MRTAITRPLSDGTRTADSDSDGEIGCLGRQGSPLGQQRHGLGRLFLRRAAEDLGGPVVVHQARPADRGGTALLPPGTLPQLGGRRHPDPVGGHLGPLGRRDLARLAEALGHRKQGGQRDLDLVGAVVVLQGQRQILSGRCP